MCVGVGLRTWCGTEFWELKRCCTEPTRTWNREFSWRWDTLQTASYAAFPPMSLSLHKHNHWSDLLSVWWAANPSAQSARHRCVEHTQLRRRNQLLGRNQGGRSENQTCLSLWLFSVCWSNCPASVSQTFTAPSFDDKILEVVAVFGGIQMAVSRVINLQHHRIAQVHPSVRLPVNGCVCPAAWPCLFSLPQCRTVKITILGDEGVPVQVDGEAWIQPPGYIKIIHKNRTQTLTRDRVSFEPRLWEQTQCPAWHSLWLCVYACLCVSGVWKHPEVLGGQTEVWVPPEPSGPVLLVRTAGGRLWGRGVTHQWVWSGSRSSHTQVTDTDQYRFRVEQFYWSVWVVTPLCCRIHLMDEESVGLVL